MQFFFSDKILHELDVCMKDAMWITREPKAVERPTVGIFANFELDWHEDELWFE